MAAFTRGWQQNKAQIVNGRVMNPGISGGGGFGARGGGPMELLVRPWLDIPQTRQPKPAAKVPDEVLPEATIRWGKPSDFTDNGFRDTASQVGFNTDDGDDDPPKRIRLNFSGSATGYEDVRVENPDDPDQYVIVRRATGLGLTGPNGENIVFYISLAGDLPGTEEGSGLEPPTPPLGEIE